MNPTLCLELSSLTLHLVYTTDIYNALTVHGLATADPLPSSVLELDRFWSLTAYNIGGHVFSLDDIEHGVLRGNGHLVHFIYPKLYSKKFIYHIYIYIYITARQQATPICSPASVCRVRPAEAVCSGLM